MNDFFFLFLFRDIILKPFLLWGVGSDQLAFVERAGTEGRRDCIVIIFFFIFFS